MKFYSLIILNILIISIRTYNPPKIIMSKNEWVQRLIDLANEESSSYSNKDSERFLLYDGTTWFCDCSGLMIALWNGRDIYNKSSGISQEDDRFNTDGLYNAKSIIDNMEDIQTNFNLLKEGEPRILYLESGNFSHVGAYLGKEGKFKKNDSNIYNVVECSNDFNKGLRFTYVNKQGKRTEHKDTTYRMLTWQKHGLPTKWISYEKNCNEIIPSKSSDCKLSLIDTQKYIYCCYEEVIIKECSPYNEEDYKKELFAYNILKELEMEIYFECSKRNENLDVKLDTQNYKENSLVILWKDIYKYQLIPDDKIKEINTPSVFLRGIFFDNYNFANFIFKIIFYMKLKENDGKRLLEEKEIKLMGKCVSITDTNNFNSNLNMIDFQCKGDSITQSYDNYELKFIEEDDDNDYEIFKSSNFKEIATQTDFKNLVNKIQSSFSYEDLNKIIIFKMNEIKNISSSNYFFDFNIDGTINKILNPVKINSKLGINEIEDMYADCDFIINENQVANLVCTLDVEKYKDQKRFSFKTFEIINEDNEIYLSKLNEIILVNDQKKDTIAKQKDNNKSNRWKIIVGVICGIIGLVIIVAVIVIIYYKYKKKANNKENQMEIKKADDNESKRDIPVKEK